MNNNLCLSNLFDILLLNQKLNSSKVNFELNVFLLIKMSKSKYASQAKAFFDYIEPRPRKKSLKPIDSSRASSECNHRMSPQFISQRLERFSVVDSPTSPSNSRFDDNSMTLYMTENDVLNDQFICVKCRRKFLLCNYYLHKATCDDDAF